MKLAEVDFTDYNRSVGKALDRIHADDIIKKQEFVLLKPNLVNASPHPVTTSVDCCEAVIRYILSFSKPRIVIADGCGDASLETDEIFDLLGYKRLKTRYDIDLVDLNHAPLVRLENSACRFFPEIHLPEIALSHFIISIPVLKAHSLSIMTGTLKNMMGLAPPKYYSGKYGIWKKSTFHDHLHERIVELNRYRRPDITLMDASIGLSEYHLGGPACSPPVKKILAGYDPVSVDRKAASLLGLDWKQIPHLN